MHEGEVAISDGLVRRLVAGQFPQWADRPLRRLPPLGTDNQLFRLGQDLLVRMSRIHWAADSAHWEHIWLPRLAPCLDVEISAPVALGAPAEDYPWHWTVVPWVEGTNPTDVVIDPEEWAASLGAFVRQCRVIPPMGGPVKTEGRGGPLASSTSGSTGGRSGPTPE